MRLKYRREEWRKKGKELKKLREFWAKYVRKYMKNRIRRRINYGRMSKKVYRKKLVRSRGFRAREVG
jgi:hypothetical protein